jgi:hypothetical protein
MAKEILIDLHYLPSLEYFCCLRASPVIHLEYHENYPKQTFRNRCYVMSAHGPVKLTVPVHGTGKKIPVGEILIDYRQKWQHQHWRTIQSAYGKAPFFEHYSPFFEKTILHPYEKLVDLNLALLTICLDLLGMKRSLLPTAAYKKTAEKPLWDLRSVVHPKKHFSENSFYQPVPYMQLFGKDFAPNLSLLDLLFCEGPHALKILDQSTRNE